MYFGALVFSAMDFVVCVEGCVLFSLLLLAVLNDCHSERAVHSLQLSWALLQSYWSLQVAL
jgi:hypothetical protein